MIVTAVRDISPSRAQIEIDGESAFVLYKGELAAYGIEQGQELGESVYREITTVLLPRRAKLRAMNLLKNRSYTQAQLREKLKAGGYPEEAENEAMAYVLSFGYINDSRYACDYIEYNKESKSKNRIVADLMKKGISGAEIEEAWEKTVGSGRTELEKAQIVQWLEKKHFQPQTASLREKQKFMAFLYRKGFTIEDIRSVLSLDITFN